MLSGEMIIGAARVRGTEEAVRGYRDFPREPLPQALRDGSAQRLPARVEGVAAGS